MKVKINIFFIGLGTMGYHIVGHLSKDSRFNVSIYNRSKEKVQKWLTEFNAKIADNLEDVANSDVIITCVGRDEDMTELVFADNGIYKNLKKGAILIDHSTTSVKLAQNMNKKFNKKDAFFIDAPVSGGESGAVKGILSVMVGGEKNIIDNVLPLIKCYAANIVHIGSSGYGQLAKMVNQICVTGLLQGLSEGLLFAEAEKMDINNLFNAISKGAAQSWQMDNRAITMHNREFDFGFAIKWMVKDLGYCIDRAKENNTKLDITEQIYNRYIKLVKKGDMYSDTSALIKYRDVEE